MRSRVTAKSWPTSSSVCSQPSERPKRSRSTFSSRGGREFKTLLVCSRSESPIMLSTGEPTCLSSMKSPRWLSSSSPMGVSSEMGSCAILRTFRTLSTGTSIFTAISSGGGPPPELLNELPGRPDELVDGLDHVHRDPDGAGLVRDGPGDGLADPPGGVGRELVAAAVLELVDGLHQTDVAFLDQVEELQAPVGVLLGDRDDEPQAGLEQ